MCSIKKEIVKSGLLSILKYLQCYFWRLPIALAFFVASKTQEPSLCFTLESDMLHNMLLSLLIYEYFCWKCNMWKWICEADVVKNWWQNVYLKKKSRMLKMFVHHSVPGYDSWSFNYIIPFLCFFRSVCMLNNSKISALCHLANYYNTAVPQYPSDY